MAEQSVYEAIQAFLLLPGTVAGLANPVGAAVPTICFENADNFTPPNPPADWVKMWVTGVLFGQESIGANTQAGNEWDESGRLYLCVFSPVGAGAVRSHGLAKQLAVLFRGLSLMNSSLEFMDAFIGEGGKSDPDDGNWYQRIVIIDWRRTEA